MGIIAPLVCGLIFGAGLLISGMVRPTKVLGFLDIFGAWDPSLAVVLGAGLFGIGWGLVGLCPGPALESLATLSPGVIVFVVAMAGGMLVHDLWQTSRPAVPRDGPLASAADG